MEAIVKILNSYSIKLLSMAFFIFGFVVMLDLVIVKDELTKTIIIFLFILGLLNIVVNIFSYIKDKIENFNEKRNDNNIAIEALKSLSKEEAKYIFDYINNGKKRFSFYDIADLLQSKIFIKKTELSDDIVVELNPVIKKYLKGKNQNVPI